MLLKRDDGVRTCIRWFVLLICVSTCLSPIVSDAFLFGKVTQRNSFKPPGWTSTNSIQERSSTATCSISNSNTQSSHRSNASKHDAHTNEFDFEKLSGLDKRLRILEEAGPDYLSDFYEPRLRSFSVKPGLASKLSVTSTCYAILALLAGRSSGLYDSMIQWSGASSDLTTDTDMSTNTNTEPRRISFQNVLQAIIESEWRKDDIFQVSLLLNTVLNAMSDASLLFSTDQSQAAIRECLSIVINARPKRRRGVEQSLSDYITFHCTNVYTKVQSILVDPPHPQQQQLQQQQSSTLSILTQNTTNLEIQIAMALDRTVETSSNELCRQIAYRTAHDSTSFDSVRLAYSLLSYIKAQNSLSTTRVLIDPPPRPLNQKLVSAALAAFFAEQNPDGLWDQGQPIFKSFRRQGFNVGNAFVFVVDTCASLLEEMPAETFRPYLPELERMLVWIETHQRMETIRREGGEDYCSTKTIRGWSSNHLSSEAGPLGWSTAQVLRYVSNMRKTIRQILHNDVLTEFKGIAHSLKGPKPEGWNRLLDSDLGLRGACSGNDEMKDCKSIKEILESRVCVPFENGINNPSMGAAYSSILFGPPGTAKTTICESIATRMGWDFVVIDTAAFLADGLSNVSARIRYVFERLAALRECVILFDEIEEFCLDRETVGISMESRMLTTAMLTAINDLRREEGSVFFMATNRLRAFDSAITRPGRFDMQLFVGTPNLNSRVELLRQALEGIVISEEVKQETMRVYKEFLESTWSLDSDVMFFNFLEGKQSAAALANIVSMGGRPPLKEEIEKNLMQQATVMTVRGSVREEFIASMEMSRF